MYSSDAEFFSKYKKTDNMVKDMYGSGGISRYIELLEQNSDNLVISKNWEFYRQLKHLRWVRNQIAHSDEKDSFATVEDVENLDIIHKSFIDRNDPLCLMKAEDEAILRRTGKYAPGYGMAEAGQGGESNFLSITIFLFLLLVTVMFFMFLAARL